MDLFDYYTVLTVRIVNQQNEIAEYNRSLHNVNPSSRH